MWLAKLADRYARSARARGEHQFCGIDTPSAVVDRTGREVHGARGANEEGVAAFELMLGALVAGLLIVITMPALLSTSAGANNIDAQANLRNAVVGAQSAYAPSQSYSYRGLPLSTLSFDSAEPAFSWTTGSCAGQRPNCVSEQVVDVNMPGDSQGVVLATWSSTTRTCWFAVDLETGTRALVDDRAGKAFDTASNAIGPVPLAGVYFARSAAGVASCSASSAVGNPAQQGWSPSVSTAGSAG
jgi:hypothetical protein